MSNVLNENLLYFSTKEIINKIAPEVVSIMEKELRDQRKYLKMIASENYCSPAVLAAQASIFTDKYSEGYPNHRYYSGCENIDELESLGQKYACELFGADHAFLQPPTGSDCNLIAYWAILKAKIIDPLFEISKKENIKTFNDLSKDQWDLIRKEAHNQRLLAMAYSCGGHLTHGYRQNISAQMFDVYTYGVNSEGFINYEELESQALKVKPLILLAGYSAYPRKLDFKKFREIADKCGAVLMVDMAHFAGLVAGKVFTDEYNPIPYADIVTMTTHKTFRGPRGAMILCKEWLSEYVDSACPTCMGGQLPQILAAKVVALKEALTLSYRDYAVQIVKNAKTLANYLKQEGIKVQTDGTDNHIVLIDVSPLGLNGRQAEYILRECGITTNRNALPNDPNGPWYTSGVRLGTAALTTLGMKEDDMRIIALTIAKILKKSTPSITEKGISKSKASLDAETRESVILIVEDLLKKYIAYPEFRTGKVEKI